MAAIREQNCVGVLMDSVVVDTKTNSNAWISMKRKTQFNSNIQFSLKTYLGTSLGVSLIYQKKIRR